MPMFSVIKTLAWMEAESKEEAWEKFKKGDYEEQPFDSSLSDVEKE